MIESYCPYCNITTDGGHSPGCPNYGTGIRYYINTGTTMSQTIISELDQLRLENERLERRIAELERVLRIYGNKDNWDSDAHILFEYEGEHYYPWEYAREVLEAEKSSQDRIMEFEKRIAELEQERDYWLNAMRQYNPMTPRGFCGWCGGGITHKPDCPRLRLEESDE